MKTLVIRIEVDDETLLDCQNQFQSMEEGILAGFREDIFEIDSWEVED